MLCKPLVRTVSKGYRLIVPPKQIGLCVMVSIPCLPLVYDCYSEIFPCILTFITALNTSSGSWIEYVLCPHFWFTALLLPFSSISLLGLGRVLKMQSNTFTPSACITCINNTLLNTLGENMST